MTSRRKLYKKQITEFRQIASDVYVLSFPGDFEFTAGQVVAIDVVSEGVPRLYSIASGEKDENVDILFDEKSDGKLTPFLSKMNVGDIIYVSEPFGSFHCDAGDGWFIASGTGVAPFVSMIRSGKNDGKTLIHGGRYDENFYFSELIENVLGENYIRCASQELFTKYYPGRLTKWLREQPVFSKEIKYYLCGSAEMVVEVRDFLISKEIPFQNIISETYF